jgi:hypothetical protein
MPVARAHMPRLVLALRVTHGTPPLTEPEAGSTSESAPRPDYQACQPEAEKAAKPVSAELSIGLGRNLGRALLRLPSESLRP